MHFSKYLILLLIIFTITQSKKSKKDENEEKEPNVFLLKTNLTKQEVEDLLKSTDQNNSTENQNET